MENGEDFGSDKKPNDQFIFNVGLKTPVKLRCNGGVSIQPVVDRLGTVY
jgi:hypothetical protein